MTNFDKLKLWCARHGANIVDVTINLHGTELEEICGEVLKMLDNKEKGLYTRLAAVISTTDPLDGMKGEITNMVSDNFEELLA